MSTIFNFGHKFYVVVVGLSPYQIKSFENYVGQIKIPFIKREIMTIKFCLIEHVIYKTFHHLLRIFLLFERNHGIFYTLLHFFKRLSIKVLNRGKVCIYYLLLEILLLNIMFYHSKLFD